MSLSDQELLCMSCITASVNVFAMNFSKSVLRNVGGGCSSSVSVPTVPFHNFCGFRWSGNSWLHCCWLAATIGFLRSASHLSLVPIFFSWSMKVESSCSAASRMNILGILFSVILSGHHVAMLFLNMPRLCKKIVNRSHMSLLSGEL